MMYESESNAGPGTSRIRGWIAIDPVAGEWGRVADSRIFRSLDDARERGPQGPGILLIEIGIGLEDLLRAT